MIAPRTARCVLTTHAAERYRERIGRAAPMVVRGIVLPIRLAQSRWPRVGLDRRAQVESLLMLTPHALWIVVDGWAKTCLALDEDDRAAVLVGLMTGIFPFRSEGPA